MQGRYPITWNGKTIGQVQILLKGLYCHFYGECSYNETAVCRLMMRCDAWVEKLGIMVPEGNLFVLKKQIPAKKIPDEKLEFFILSELEGQEAGIFVPISSEEPFEYLTNMKNAVFENRDGVIGAWIPNIIEMQGK